MKKIILAVAGLTVVALVYLAVEGRKVQEITTEIEISAPPSKVWSIIMNIDRWQEWSPIINDSSGVPTVGSTLSIAMVGKDKDTDGPKYNPIIKEIENLRYFRWRAHMLAGFVFTNDKILELEETESGTRFIHKETFSGLLAPIFCRQMEKGVPPMLNSMNKALKDLAEK